MNAILPNHVDDRRSPNGYPAAVGMPSDLGAPAAAMTVSRETGLHQAGSWRRTVHRSDSFLIDNSSVSAAEEGPSGYETRHQVVLPYLGLFEYNVGPRTCQVDSACTLFVLPDREYHDAHPVPGVGHAGLVINLMPDKVEEFVFSTNSRHAFSEMVRPATRRLKLLTHHILRTFEATDDPLFADEWTVAVLAEAFGAPPLGTPRKSGMLERAKLLLHAREGERLSLDDIAREVGVSGIYLTQEFTRVEGIPLYRYQLLLRMNRALLELPHCNDITKLALNLGFSNHSHFTTAFRRHFGVTPSEYRDGAASLALMPRSPARRTGRNDARAIELGKWPGGGGADCNPNRL